MPSSQSQTRSAADALLQSIELAVAAEELGASGAYFRVHHFALGAFQATNQENVPRLKHYLRWNTVPELTVDLPKEIAMLFFYLPMIIIGAMFGANPNGRVTRIAHPDDAE